MQELPKDSSSGMTLNAEPMQAQSEPATLASFTAKTIKNNKKQSLEIKKRGRQAPSSCPESPVTAILGTL
jgi:hypothetical protein